MLLLAYEAVGLAVGLAIGLAVGLAFELEVGLVLLACLPHMYIYICMYV